MHMKCCRDFDSAEHFVQLIQVQKALDEEVSLKPGGLLQRSATVKPSLCDGAVQ